MRAAGIVLVALILACGRPAGAEALRPQLDDLVGHFLEVAFGVEYAGLTDSPQVVARWAGPVVGVSIQGRLTQPFADLTSKHLNTLAKESGLKFKQIKPGDPGPNIQIVFLKRSEMGALKGPNVDARVIESMASDPTMVCYFLAWRSPPDTIVKALVAVNAEADPVRIDSCLLEELTQVLGLPNDVKAYWQTMFNPTDSSTVHSPWDALYVRTLYGPAVKPGMTPAQARPLIEAAFAEALSTAR